MADKIKAELKKEAEEKGLHPSALRKHFAFDMLINRLCQNAPGVFILKGGYLMELRIVTGRTTLDLDLLMRMKKIFDSFESMAMFMRRTLADAVEDPLGEHDLFSFNFGEASREIDGGGGGARFPVKLILGGKTFEDFHVDLAMEDIETRIASVRKTPVIPPLSGQQFEMEGITAEQHFAEKVHAYTRPRKNGNSRIKDFVDLYLLVQTSLNVKETKEVLVDVFEFWSTHELPKNLPFPPDEWRNGFSSMVSELAMAGLSLEDAHKIVAEFYEDLL